MKLVWTKDAWNQYTLLLGNDRTKVRKINELIKMLLRDPQNPSAKSEILKHKHEGLKSVRIDKKIVFCIQLRIMN